ncbi:MAG: heat-inducible transcriptional repressor HrcA [Alphaproteobacteria bacterium]|nr:MAG: heat-inducible transcriptional repressor HrcA [Alphaproteobacteria bacterium]
MSREPSLADLNERSRAVFRRLVETYLETGEPVGSRTLARAHEEKLSPASIRNVMQDLEELGLLGSPHVSAGRVPTQIGLRLFVDGLLEIGDISEEERAEIESKLGQPDPDLAGLLDRAGEMLSGLTHGAGLVLAPKSDAAIKHIEFVPLSAENALAILVTEDGQVENRLFHPPPGMTPSAMQSASNFLNTVLRGRTLNELRNVIAQEVDSRRQEIDSLTRELVEAGAAIWDGEKDEAPPSRLIVRGRSNLIENVKEQDLDRIRELLDDLERKQDIVNLLQLAETGEGVRIFIGSENKLFSLSGSSLVISPYMNADRKMIGAVGVIGPTRLNYGRIVPIVDYTARLVGRMISGRPKTG